VLETSGVQRFALTDNRIAALEGTTLYVKEGALDATWVTLSTNAKGLALPND
jgi:hypothetical protein